MNRLIAIIFISAFLFSYQLCYAQEGPAVKEPKKEKQAPGIKSSVTNEISGELVSLSPLKNPKYIGIAYVKNGVSCDAQFKISPNVNIAHKKSLDEIKIGDMVSIKYKETTEVDNDGKEVTRCIAEIIQFAGPATGAMPRRKLPGEEPPVPEPEQPEGLASTEEGE